MTQEIVLPSMDQESIEEHNQEARSVWEAFPAYIDLQNFNKAAYMQPFGIYQQARNLTQAP